jgi:hypothetical protein
LALDESYPQHHNIINLLCIQRPTLLNAMPLLGTSPAAGGDFILGNEYRMPSHECLLLLLKFKKSLFKADIWIMIKAQCAAIQTYFSKKENLFRSRRHRRLPILHYKNMVLKKMTAKKKILYLISFIVVACTSFPSLAEGCGSCMISNFDRFLPPVFVWCIFIIVWFLAVSALEGVKSFI